MELIGRVISYTKDDEWTWILFRCTNKEEFKIKVEPTLPELPKNELLRIWTIRIDDEYGQLEKENALCFWEKFDKEERYFIEKTKKRNVFTWVKEEVKCKK